MRHDTLTRGSTLLAAMLLCGCADMLGLAGEKPAPPAPPDPAVLAAQALTSHLALVQRLIESAPDAQAQIVARVKHRYDLAPSTPDDELDYALVLAAPGHAGSQRRPCSTRPARTSRATAAGLPRASFGRWRAKA